MSKYKIKHIILMNESEISLSDSIQLEYVYGTIQYERL